MSLDPYFEANRANWDDRTPIHTASRQYDLEGFLAGDSTLLEEDIANVGDVTGKTLLHTQCHIGLDTLSWARRGASVTGLDFSPESINTARDIATRAGLEARFVEANVYAAVEALEGEQFDVVFTGVGALCWLPDATAWTHVMGKLVRPGGAFYIREFHPVLWSLDEDAPPPSLSITRPYFETTEPLASDEAITYTDNPTGEPIANTRTYEWNHGLGHVITALIQAGLRIEFVHEYDWCESPALPWMVEEGRWRWALPEGRERLPLAYAIRATKPA